MSVFEVRGGPVNHRYLMNKSKSDLARMYLELLDLYEERANPPPVLSESCSDCGRKIMKRPEVGCGFVAKCGRRLVEITECRVDSPCPEHVR